MFFILTAPESPRGADQTNKAPWGRGLASLLRPFSRFDSTKGFPGEGPPRPELAFLRTWQGVNQEWFRRAQAGLAGTVSIEHANFDEMMTDEKVHQTLLDLVRRGNSQNPIAARFQSHPDRVERLLGPESHSVEQAYSGSAYSFSSRPFQYRRPRVIPMQNTQRRAAVDEIERLMTECHAVEVAPEHDSDKALTPSSAEWEHRPLRQGNWPRERTIPVCSSWQEQQEYDRQCTADMKARQRLGKPFRDFESAVFTVDKKDGGHRLCTDYRPLNLFQEKTHFKMDTVQTVAELIQPNDFGMLCDLKDCYLTMGLHPSQRKYCRFRSPASGQRLQWRTVSFGMSEAPRLCTKLLRPLIGLLKQLGIRCMLYIDDLLLLHQDRIQLARGMAVAISLLQKEVGLNIKTSRRLNVCLLH